MPIVGLTDDIAPRLPSLGKLRKGGPKEKREKNGREFEVYGKDLQHFRFDGAKAELTEAFEAAYGAAPGSLTVYLPYPSADACFETWQEEWSAGGLVHRCDGRTMTIWREGSGYVRGQKPCPYFTGEKKRTSQVPGCDEVGRLLVILPDLVRAGHVGYVTLETHSKHDMLNILGALKAAEEAAGERGLLGIPFTLYRREEAISTPADNGGRTTRKKWLVFIEPQAAWVQVRMQLAHAEALSLEAPIIEVIDGETGEIVEQAAPRQIEAPKAGQAHMTDDVRKIVDKYNPPAETRSAGAQPNQAMWDKYLKLEVEAREAGLQVGTPKDTITAEELAVLGRALRAQIEETKAKAAQQPAGNGQASAKPDQAMLKAWSEIVQEAKALRLPVPTLTRDVTAAQLSEVARQLREAVTAAKGAAQAPKNNSQKVAEQAAAQGQGVFGQPAPAEKKKFTREELGAYVKQLGEEAIRLGIVGPAWKFNPRWSDEEVIKVGKDLKARIAEKQVKEPAHV